MVGGYSNTCTSLIVVHRCPLHPSSPACSPYYPRLLLLFLLIILNTYCLLLTPYYLLLTSFFLLTYYLLTYYSLLATVLLILTTYFYYYFYICYFSTTTATTPATTTSTTSTASTTTSTTTSISLPSFVFPSSPTTANTSTVASVQRYRSSFLPALDQGEFLAVALPNLRDLRKFHTMRLLNYYLELITFDGHSQFNQISRTSI